MWYWIRNRTYLFNYSFSDCVQYKKWKIFANNNNHWFESVTVKADIWFFTHVWVSTHPVICCCTVPAGCVSKLPNGEIGVPQKDTRGSTVLPSLPRPKLILIVSTCLLVLLFLSAAFLLYRIGRIHSQFSENPVHTGRWVRCFNGTRTQGCYVLWKPRWQNFMAFRTQSQMLVFWWTTFRIQGHYVLWKHSH